MSTSSTWGSVQSQKSGVKTVLNKFAEYIDLHLLITSLIALAVFFMTTHALAQSSAATVKIDGSSTVFPIAEAVAEEFQKSTKTRVTVGISGTGGGFKKFCRGETDVQNASRPIQTSEMEVCKAAGIKYYEIPVAYDAMVVVVNPKNEWVKEIKVEELKKMWEPEAQGKITKWNQVNPKWPDQPLKLFGAGSDSGTFDYFTEAIVGKAKSSRGDYTASEDDNTLVQGISTDKNAIGYIPLSYYEENRSKLKALAILGGDKAPVKTGVLPNTDTVISGQYFPLSRPVFIYVNETSYRRPEVKEFATFLLKNGARLIPTVKYIPLPNKAYDLGLQHLSKGKLGTVFQGHSEVGIKIEDLMKKESRE